MVEDNEAFRILIRNIISVPGDIVLEFDAAEPAIAGYLQHSPDITFMDIDLKGKDGLWGCRELLKINPQAKIIIVTSHNGEVFRKAAREAGAVGFVWKEELETLRTILGTLV